MKRVHTLRARTEKYTDRQTGQEKQGYTTAGYILAKEDGSWVYKLDAIPVNFDGWLFAGDLPTKQVPTVNTGQGQVAEPSNAVPQSQPDFGDLEDSIPF